MSKRWYKVAVVGSRRYPAMWLVGQAIHVLAARHNGNLMIVSGGAQGVDTAAEAEANRMQIPYTVYPAAWSRLGKQAGMVRNNYIIGDADEVYAFWDGESRGTRNSIDLAMTSGKPLTIITAAGEYEQHGHGNEGPQYSLPV